MDNTPVIGLVNLYNNDPKRDYKQATVFKALS